MEEVLIFKIWFTYDIAQFYNWAQIYFSFHFQ